MSSDLKKSSKEGWPIQCFEFPNVDPVLITITATGVPESSGVFPTTGIYRVTTNGAIQAVKDIVPSMPDATTVSHEFNAGQPEYFGITAGDTISVVGTIGTIVKFGLV